MTKLRLTDAEKPLWMMARCAAMAAIATDALCFATCGVRYCEPRDEDEHAKYEALMAAQADRRADAAIEALRERVEGGV